MKTVVLNHRLLACAAFLHTLILAVVSCRQEDVQKTSIVTQPVTIAPDEALLSFSVGSPVDVDTKSVITDANFESGIRTLLVLIVGEDGSWKKIYREASAPSWLSTGIGHGVSMSGVRVRADYQAYNIYVFANMGDVTDAIPVDGSGRLLPNSYVHSLPDNYVELNTKGLPMCATTSIAASDVKPFRSVGTLTVPLTLRRLMAKIVLSVDKTGMSGDNEGVLNSSSVYVRQVAKVLRPFAVGGSRATNVSELYSASTDYFTFSSGGGTPNHSSITLYIPENHQGTASDISEQRGKVNDVTDVDAALATYLEYNAAKVGTSDGVSGNITYRAYLGENETDDYNVIGDRIYKATLFLSWNGMWEGTWRVTQGDWADARALVISAAAGSSVEMTSSNTKAGSQKVRKATPTAFYMNFFPGGTSGEVAHSRKDMSSWPYGWVASVDGSSVNMTGTSGTIKNAGNVDLINWSYDSATDCLSMEAVAGAPASADIHTLQFKTVDGRKSSNVVYFTTSIPFEFRWKDDGEPNHVAQRGVLEAIDPDTNAHQTEGRELLAGPLDRQWGRHGRGGAYRRVQLHCRCHPHR